MNMLIRSSEWILNPMRYTASTYYQQVSGTGELVSPLSGTFYFLV